MSSQPQTDVNTLLHNMQQQILALTTQLAELQPHPPAATPSVEKFKKKVKVVADPGAFKGDRAQFAEWWIKLQIWVKANWDVFANDFEIATAVAGPPPKPNYSQRSPGSSNQKHNHSHGFQPFELQPGQGAPMDIGAVQGGQTRRFTCYNCGEEGHMAQNCTNGAQTAHQKNNQGCQARQLEAEKPDDWLTTLAGHSYDEIRAFFYDQQVNKMKAQGKEFGA
ncbi:hypothetical protein SERLA73DRAFT_68740 [Serpula lacrymans var. lacrymans S7.3]|uniref:CCHC-type domain-containing protein n=2 Tax=Serpula lacrymans var. lacrymans TaxID=341189 RepID=F8PI03_SERL3|nr:uncharacterized protein SERLADRAFT_432505 [Serpula lacrymans var. lacrymans S7.9]EGO05099.1 hypothetical protein SERLA73DRAFT_68740 [Serpula lacrymans var. lacrymans S7.3]EGO30865.1 hypothetical protein SERLADRAFT_432505 [Serpula lacrymans var. lacrymans S7.9]